MRRRGGPWGRRVVSAVTSLAMVWSLTPAPALAEAGRPPAEAGSLEEPAGQGGQDAPDPGLLEASPEQGEADAAQAEAGSSGLLAGDALTDDVPEESAGGAATDASTVDPAGSEVESVAPAPGPTAMGDAPEAVAPTGEEAAVDDETNPVNDETDGGGTAAGVADGVADAADATAPVAPAGGDAAAEGEATTALGTEVGSASESAAATGDPAEKRDGEAGDGEPAMATQAGAVASGTCGTCPWSIDADGTLTIGAGTLGGPASYDWPWSWPWSDYSDSICVVRLTGRVVASASTRGMFAGCDSLSNADLGELDTSAVTDMHSMFWSCDSLASLDVSRWDTSRVSDMNSMFLGCRSLSSLDVSHWNTSQVTDMGRMFSSCFSLSSLDVSQWDTSRAINLNGIFYFCESLMSLDVSTWNTSQAESIGGMFQNCYSLSSLDVSHWNTSRVTEMEGVFNCCRSLSHLDLSRWDTSHVTSMWNLFLGCSGLSFLDLSGWDTSQVTDMGQVFDGCTYLDELRVGESFSIGSACMFPNGSSRRGWWSCADQKWYTKDEIVARRSRVADTYLSSVDIVGATVKLSATSFAYDGTEKRPTVESVRVGAVELVPGIEYMVGYTPECVDVGSCFVTVTGRGSFKGTVTVRYSISKATTSVKLAAQTKTYTGKALAYSGTVTKTGSTGKVTYRYYSDAKCAKEVKPANVKAAGTYYVKATVAADANHKAATSAAAKLTVAKAKSTIKLAAQTRTYTGKALAYTGKVTKSGSTGKVTYRYYSDAKCTKEVKAANVKAAKTYYVKATVAASANHKAATSVAVKFTVAKAANPLAVKAASKTASLKTLKTKAVVVAPMAVSKAKGKVTYAKVSGSSALTVNKSTGKVTVKKGTKRGTYTAKVKVTAAGNANYKSGSKTVAVKVTVK